MKKMGLPEGLPLVALDEARLKKTKEEKKKEEEFNSEQQKEEEYNSFVNKSIKSGH